MDYTRNMSLDMNMMTGMEMVKVKQGDSNTRFLKIKLYKDGVQFVPDNTMVVQFRCQKPDGKAVLNNAAINSDGSITITMTSQVMAVEGKLYCDICITKYIAATDTTEACNQVISSVPFAIEVIPSPDVANLAVSTDEFGVLELLVGEARTLKVQTLVEIGQAKEAVEEYKEAAEAAQEAAETARDEAVEAKEDAEEIAEDMKYVTDHWVQPTHFYIDTASDSATRGHLMMETIMMQDNPSLAFALNSEGYLTVTY